MGGEKFSVRPAKQGYGIYISEYEGNYEKFIVPEKVNGETIVGLSAFAFSEHRELLEVCLPETLQSIGAHAFYNCRALKRLVLGDRVTEIGDGAFKNCFHLSEIEITRSVAHTKCLKGILSEVNNEVMVTIRYSGETARLVFPYYLYNYEENTPARIINQITEGSGILYRECIGGEDIHYKEYDALFGTGMHIDVQDSAWRIACCRLSYPVRLSRTAKENYRSFLYENRIALVNRLVRQEKDAELKEFLSLNLLEREDVRNCIEAARKTKQMEGLGILLAYQKEKYGLVRKKYEF